MNYKYSELDRKNQGWFTHDKSRATLLSIKVTHGRFRCIHDLQVNFSYPITAIAGRNGSGKTTILALAACAYHNYEKAYRLPDREKSYYTFSDFFIQAAEDSPIDETTVGYQILHNGWRNADSGVGWQFNQKLHGHRWSSKRRVNRTVVYLGIDRIVPDAERSVSKSYRNSFKPVIAQGWEDKVRIIVGRILKEDCIRYGHKYHSKHSLPVVSTGKITYSGFNMGAGEEALFKLFSTANNIPDGSLILVDEIELGLHEEAQTRLIHELKVLCEKRKFQIICTTHSSKILRALPPDERIFLERISDKVNVIPGISTAFARGKLSGHPKAELDILVEDRVANLIIEAGLSTEIRQRVNIMPIGSAGALMRHLASKYKEGKKAREVCALLDGDQRKLVNENTDTFLKALETLIDREDAKEWLEKRVNYLPGSEWPESWVASQRSDVTYKRLGAEFDLSREQVEQLLNDMQRAGKKKEFLVATTNLNLGRDLILHKFSRVAFESEPNELMRITDFVKAFLS